MNEHEYKELKARTEAAWAEVSRTHRMHQDAVAAWHPLQDALKLADEERTVEVEVQKRVAAMTAPATKVMEQAVEYISRS